MYICIYIPCALVVMFLILGIAVSDKQNKVDVIEC